MFKNALIAAALLCLNLSAPAAAGGYPSAGDIARFDVLPGWRSERGTHMAAFRVRLAPGWKTYWRAPGDAGIPPRFDWTGSSNIRSVKFHWPAPKVYYLNGMRTVGYKQELVLPIELTPVDPSKPIKVRAAVELGVCQDVCVPLAVRVSADLGLERKPDARISAALAAVPPRGGSAGLREVTCGVEPISDGVRLTARIDLPRMGRDEVAVFELPDQEIWISEAEASRDGPVLTAEADVVPPVNRPFLLDRSDVRITVLGDGRAVDIQGCSGG